MKLFSKKIHYKLENLLSRHGLPLFYSLVLVFIGFLMFISLLRFLFGLIWDLDIFSPLSSMWITFFQMTDPGNMTIDHKSTYLERAVAVLAGLTGALIFSTLIAFISSQVDTILWNFRKGKSEVIEKKTTLILGWNERIYDLLRELLIAKESEPEEKIVVLSRNVKWEMDDDLDSIFNKKERKRIITRTGDRAFSNDLKRASIEAAKSVIILATCGQDSTDEEKQSSDSETIKTALATIAATNNNKAHKPIFVEIFNQSNRTLLSAFKHMNILSLNSWEILAKILAQTSIFNGLSSVYNTLLSFEDNEIYIYKPGKRQSDSVAFGEIYRHFEDGIPLGYIEQNSGTYSGNKMEGIHLNPPVDTEINPEDELVIIARDNSTIKYTEPIPLKEPAKYSLPFFTQDTSEYKILLIGWNNIAPFLLKEYGNFLGSLASVDLLASPIDYNSKSRIKKSDSRLKEIGVIAEKNPLNYEDLQQIDFHNYSTIVILAQKMLNDEGDEDTHSILILNYLRQILEGKEASGRPAPRIVTQIVNSRNLDMVIQTGIDDFIISNQLITKTIAQISEEPRMKEIYYELFKPEGSEIYLKPTSLYFSELPHTLSFHECIVQAQKRREICLGFRQTYAKKNYGNMYGELGIRLNPDKSEEITLTENDYLIVLAEDES